MTALPNTALPEEARALATDADHQLAAELAAHSAELLRALRASGIDDPDALRKQGDRRSHELLVTELAARRPADAVLSEEGKDPAQRLGARRVWIVDPLDGTREFGEPDRPDWAVHVALVIDGFPVAGAVALPALGEVWSTAGASTKDRPTGTVSTQGKYEWDSAAPVAVALAHGLHASRLDGTPLTYNNPDPYLPDLLIAHPDWARPALDAVRLPPC